MASVSWRALLPLLALVGVLSTVMGMLGSWWFLGHFQARVPLGGQPMVVTMPEGVPVQVAVDAVETGTEANAAARSIPMRFKETMRVVAHIDSRIPINTVVPYHAEIPLKTTLHVDTKAKTRILGIDVTLPVVADIPVDLTIPVDLSVPINQKVPLKMSLPVKADIDQIVQIPVPGSFTSRLSFPQGPMRLDIQGTDMQVPLWAVTLQGTLPALGPVELGPVRQGSPASPPSASQAQ
jgi:hypothetical protein